jgi:hypothetical protein
MNEREEKCDERTRSSSAIVGSLVVKSLSACDKGSYFSDYAFLVFRLCVEYFGTQTC